MRKWTRFLVVLPVSAALVLTSCTLGPSRRPDLAVSGTQQQVTSSPTAHTSSSVPSSPVGPGGSGRTAPPIEWQPCPASVPRTSSTGVTFRVDCATVRVPVSYAAPQRGALPLHVARARSADPSPSSGAHPGPGRTGNDTSDQDDAGDGAAAGRPALLALPADLGQAQVPRIADIAAAVPPEVRAHFTVITVDLRGTGLSAGFGCVADSTAHAILGMGADPTSSAGGEQLASIARQLTFDCDDAVGAGLTTINATNASDDLDTLRAALGTPTLTVLAHGYAATIAAVYADRFPGRVAAMVLDSPTDPLTGPVAEAKASATAAETVLAQFAAACDGFPKGCLLGDDPVAAVTGIVHKLATSGEAAGDWVMTGGSVLLALLTMLPDRNSWPELATAIAQLGQRRAQPLATLLTDRLGGDDLSARLTGQLVYRCNDTAVRLHDGSLADAVTEVRSAAPLFGPFTVALAGLCGSWPAPDHALGRLSAQGAAPILVLGAVNNPRYPYPGARSVETQLASASLVSWQSAAAQAYPASACVRTIVDAYLLRGARPDSGVLCPP